MFDSILVNGYWVVGALMANGAFLFRSVRAILAMWFVFGVIFLGLGVVIESKYGAIHEKSLSFYVVLTLVFSLLGLPGYVIRFLKKR